MKIVFVNPERCIGCKQCQIACSIEHSESKNIYSAMVETVKSLSRIHVGPGRSSHSSFPNKCQNCDPASCIHICPTGATYRDEEWGMVRIDHSKCITCAMCAMVCPFDVLTFQPLPGMKHSKAIAVKCDQCIERQKKGKTPACVEACKVNALEFGNINKLIHSAGNRHSVNVSTAMNERVAVQDHVPANVKTWRQWGEKIEQINNR